MNKRIRINGILYEAVEQSGHKRKLSFKNSPYAPNDDTGLLLDYELIVDGKNNHIGGITVKSVGEDTSFKVSVNNIMMDDTYVNAYTSREWYEDAEKLADKAADVIVKDLGFDKTCRELKKLGFRIGTPGGRYPKGHVYAPYNESAESKNIEPRKIDDEVDALFDELVPSTGKAKTVAGELIRALCRIVYRWYNDGDCIGVGYGNETCNAAARYLIQKTTSDSGIPSLVNKLWGTEYSRRDLNKLSELVVDYINDHPKLKDRPNSIDMWDLYDPEEDMDPEEYEDEDDYYDDDYDDEY